MESIFLLQKQSRTKTEHSPIVRGLTDRCHPQRIFTETQSFWNSGPAVLLNPMHLLTGSASRLNSPPISGQTVVSCSQFARRESKTLPYLIRDSWSVGRSCWTVLCLTNWEMLVVFEMGYILWRRGDWEVGKERLTKMESIEETKLFGWLSRSQTQTVSRWMAAKGDLSWFWVGGCAAMAHSERPWFRQWRSRLWSLEFDAFKLRWFGGLSDGGQRYEMEWSFIHWLLAEWSIILSRSHWLRLLRMLLLLLFCFGFRSVVGVSFILFRGLLGSSE